MYYKKYTEPEEPKREKEKKSNGEEFRNIDYSHVKEVDMAKRFFDWKFYSTRGNYKKEIKTDKDLYAYLHDYLKFSDRTMGELKHEEQIKWAKKKDYENLTRQWDNEPVEDDLPF